MATSGRGVAIAELGKNHHEVHGRLTHMPFLGVHHSLDVPTAETPTRIDPSLLA